LNPRITVRKSVAQMSNTLDTAPVYKWRIIMAMPKDPLFFACRQAKLAGNGINWSPQIGPKPLS
jgi:hypothetical protein